MKEISVKLVRPLKEDALFHTELTLPDEYADLVQDWLEEWLPRFLEVAISLYHITEVKTRELGEKV